RCFGYNHGLNARLKLDVGHRRRRWRAPGDIKMNRRVLFRGIYDLLLMRQGRIGLGAWVRYRDRRPITEQVYGLLHRDRTGFDFGNRRYRDAFFELDAEVFA